MLADTLTIDLGGRPIGQKLRWHRLALELTQDELAREAGVHRVDLCNVERGYGTKTCAAKVVATLARLEQAK